MKYKNLSLIVAVSNNNVIGVENDLPWSIKEDLKIFKETTLNKDIIMGKNTFLSLPKVLPNRIHHVLTTSGIENEEVFIYNNINEIFKLIEENPEKEFIVIGGGNIYKTFLPYISTAYVSHIDLIIEKGDTFFNFININEFEVVDQFKYSNFVFKKYVLKK